MSRPQRIAVIGSGHVGSAAAYALMIQGLVGEIILIDSDTALAEAEAEDLSDANALSRPVRIRAGSYEDAAGADIAVITAGAATQRAESRLSLASASAGIVNCCADRLASAGFAGILLVAANPVDLMSLLAFRRAGLPSSRVIGTGTLLDSRRLAQRLGDRLDIDPRAIDCLVLGEHGDSEVAAFSTGRVGGLTLEAFAAPAPMADHQALAELVRKDGYRIIAGKGSTTWGIAAAIARICEAVLRDEGAVLPVSTLMTGQFGIEGLYLSLPCVLGASGVERVLEPPLTRRETQDLQASAKALRNALPLLALTKGG